MNVYVCIKQVPDTETRIVLTGDGRIDESNIKWIVSPYDEFAIEEALLLKEKCDGCSVTVVSLGPERIQDAIRVALAMGADQGIHILADAFLDANNVARALANAIRSQGHYEMIFTGKQAIDDDGYQLHLRLAHLLNAAAATNVIACEYNTTNIICSREIDEGALEKLELPMPAVIAVTKGINEPRYPSFMGIRKATRAEYPLWTAGDVGVDPGPAGVHWGDITPPPAREGAAEIISADTPEEAARQLVDKLLAAKVI